MKRLIWLLAIILSLYAPSASAHRSGCHRWHTCPSDHGTYEMGEPARPANKQARPQAAAVETLSLFTGRVVGVSDGDTISALRNGRAERIRLHGVDSPEKRQAFGQRAKQFTSDLVFGKDVTVRPVTQDKYGRLVAEVVLDDGRSLGEELLKAGLAWWYRQYSTDITLETLETGARLRKLGLWSDPTPTPPWEFRRTPKRAQAS